MPHVTPPSLNLLPAGNQVVSLLRGKEEALPADAGEVGGSHCRTWQLDWPSCCDGRQCSSM